MKKTVTLKTFMLFLMLVAMMLPIASFAQNDNIIQNWDDENGVRDFALTWTITNNSFGTSPLGSGLFILAVAGAGYAVARRRRNRKNGAMILLALAMILGTTGCRKKIVEPIVNPSSNGTTYTINLNTGNGSKVNVTGADVTFTNGDKLIVAHNGKYVGTLNHNGTVFTGDITTTVADNPDDRTPLYFYFLGNKATGTLTAGTTTSCTVNISDQTDYPHLPVISFSAANRNFDGSGSYEAALNNKCSLMKFNVTTPSTSPICITGMNNKVTVLFNDRSVNDGFSYSVDSEDGGLIKLKGGSGSPAEKWAIVLPQDELAAGEAGSIYAQSGTYTTFTGSRPLIHAIEANGYYHEGGDVITMTVNTATDYIDLGDITASTTIATGKIVIGTLANNVKISIADGAEVILSGVTINGVNNSSYKWAGLNCLGDATIVLADGTTNTVKGFYCYYPGIHVPSGYTLTIHGTGTLNATSYDGTNGAAGIGGGWQISCGNITIIDGRITATGTTGAAGIGGACYNSSCGDITISGGTITATGGNGAPGIGSGKNSSGGNITISGGTITAQCGSSGGAGIGSGSQSHCNAITISGGTITATAGSSGAGIGSGVSYASCGVINITGGKVTATGGTRAAGIGSGYTSCSCSDITIENTVTKVEATKGQYATYSIGAGVYNSTCGTVTIGGVEGAISTSPYTYEPLPEGALSGKFTINGSGDQVYFSQGNLKYSAGTWSFHTNQYDMCFTSKGSVSTYYTSSGTFDLFGYGTSGYNDKYPYMTDMNGSYYYDDLTGSTGSNYDWGVHNTISNGGTGWRTPTINEWDYLLNHRVTSSNVRYAKATVNGVAGLIILPDDWSTGYYNLSSVANSANSSFNETNITLSEWSSALEAHGAVFLPVFSYREGTTVVDIVGYTSFYWSSTYYGSVYGPDFYGANCLSLAEYEYDQNVYSYVATDFPGPLYDGHFVRLVKDAN